MLHSHDGVMSTFKEANQHNEPSSSSHGLKGKEKQWAIKSLIHFAVCTTELPKKESNKDSLVFESCLRAKYTHIFMF